MILNADVDIWGIYELLNDAAIIFWTMTFR